MATDPPAASALPEIADLDPAFDLTTFATERSTARPVTAPEPARLQVRPAQAPFGLPGHGEGDDRRRGGWLTDSAIQLAIAAVLVLGAVAIMFLAVRGRQASSTLEPAPQVQQPAPEVPQALPPPAPAPEESKTRPAPPARVPETPARARGASARADHVPSSPRTTAAAVSTSGTKVRRAASPRPLPGAAPPKTPPAPAPTVIQHAMLNVNARPWANVWLDGRPVGETPLANLRVPAGEHELIFRHPDLGERRVMTRVEPGRTTRVAVDLRE